LKWKLVDDEGEINISIKIHHNNMQKNLAVSFVKGL
jgi:hypothetical protein